MSLFAGTAFVNILPDFAQFASGLAKGVTKNQAALIKTGKSMTKYLTVPILAAGAASIKLATDFEHTITQIRSLTGLSAQQAVQASKDILALAPAVGRAPQELAEAYYFVASSGIEASKVLGVVEASAKAAAIGLGDTQTVADAVTSAMNAYATSGLTAAEAVDTLVEAVRLGKGEASQIAPVLGSILPTASELGVSFSDVSAALASMTLTGDDAALAATKINAIMSALLKVTPQSADAFESVGLNVDDLRDSLGEKGLLPTLQTIKAAVGDDTSALAEMFPNVRALRGILSLTGNNAENVSRIFADMADSTGALDKAFKITTEDPLFQMQQAFAQLKVAAISFGEVLLPIVTTITHAFGELFGAITNLSPVVKGMTSTFLGLVAVIGPTLFVIGKLPKLIKDVQVGFSSLITVLQNPWFLAATAAIAIIYGIEQALGAAEEREKQFSKATIALGNIFVEQMGRIANSFQAGQLVKRIELVAAAQGALLHQTNPVGKALGELGQKAASAFRNGEISAEQAILAFQAVGLKGTELEARITGLGISMADLGKEVDVNDLVNALVDADGISKTFDADLVVLINRMAEQGTLSSEQYADALLKAGVPMDTINQKIKNMSGVLTDTRENLDITGQAIHVFTFSTQKDFNSWAKEVSDNFDSFITSNTKFKEAFKLTTAQFKRDLAEQVKIAQQGADDMKVLTDLPIPKEFEQFLLDRGPAAVHAFVAGSKSDRDDFEDYWKKLKGATDDYNKELGDLGKVSVTTPVDADTDPARKAINGLMEDLKKQGFTLNPQSGQLVFGQLKHSGGIAGMGGDWIGRALKRDEVSSILQKGEFVIQRDIVSQPGMLEFLQMLNGGKVRASEYHSGGVVDFRSQMIDQQGLRTAIANLMYAYNRPPVATIGVNAKLPSASELIEQLIGNITGGAGRGLSPNAARYMAVIRTMFGDLPMGTISRRTILGTNTWSQHAYGNAVDVMTGTNDLLRKSVADFSSAHRTLLSIAHLLADPWYPSPLGNHYNHVHADFNPQGTGTPPPGGGWIGARRGFHGRLRQDTNIRAHSGERVDIGQGKAVVVKGELSIKDWRHGLADLQGELEWLDRGGSR